MTGNDQQAKSYEYVFSKGIDSLIVNRDEANWSNTIAAMMWDEMHSLASYNPCL